MDGGVVVADEEDSDDEFDVAAPNTNFGVFIVVVIGDGKGVDAAPNTKGLFDVVVDIVADVVGGLNTNGLMTSPTDGDADDDTDDATDVEVDGVVAIVVAVVDERNDDVDCGVNNRELVVVVGGVAVARFVS